MSRKTPNSPPQETSLVRALMVPILLFAGVLIIALLIGIFGDDLAGGSENASQAANSGNTLDAETMRRFRDEWDQLGVAYGPADAPVTVREFADYQCPACGSFAGTAERIREEWADTGKVRFIFFDFPLPMHEHARTAAIAARCAGRQDAYWPFHQQLFDNQEAWSSRSDPTSTFLDYAVASGIRVEPVERCLEQRATESVVAQNAEIAREIKLRSTPTVLVGDRVFSGVTGYQTLVDEIENQLAGTAAAQ